MRSKWKSHKIPKLCYRYNFLSSLTKIKQKDLFYMSSEDMSALSKSNKISRLDFSEGVVKLNLGSCKRFRLFKALEGFTLEVWNGCNYNSFQVNDDMIKQYVGSFVFTKRFTRDIHKSHVQKRQKRAFNKKK